MGLELTCYGKMIGDVSWFPTIGIRNPATNDRRPISIIDRELGSMSEIPDDTAGVLRSQPRLRDRRQPYDNRMCVCPTRVPMHAPRMHQDLRFPKK